MSIKWIKLLKPKLLSVVNLTVTCKGPCKIDYIVITLLVLLTLLIGSLVILVGYFLLQEAQDSLPLLSKGSLHMLSVFCEDLSLSYDEDIDTFDAKKNHPTIYIDGKGKYVCENKNFTAVVLKVVERQSRLRQSKGLDNRHFLSCGNENLARKSGDLTVTFSRISHHQIYPDDGLDATLHWDKHIKYSYIDPAIHYRRGEITIPEGRAYFVYASVHFNISREYADTGKTRRFTIRICRKLHDYEQTILGKSELFHLGKEAAISSLNIASILQLTKDDIIYVKVSHAKQLIHESTGTTFGLYPL